MHSTGEKTVPGPIEQIVSSNSMYVNIPYIVLSMALIFSSVAGAVMFGRGRDQAGVLVEPSSGHVIETSDTGQLAALRNKLWCVPYGQELNQSNKIVGH
jgi:hypothetical protein